MSFRIKLLTIVGLIITVSIVLSFAMTYIFARQQLEAAAKKEMEQTAAMIAKQAQIALNTIKVDMELLAELKLIRKTIRHPLNKTLTDETNQYFQEVVKKNEIYQSINLLDRNALCIASSYPDIIGYVTMQKFVEIRTDFKNALSGRTSISQILLSMGTGRPYIAVSTPVIENGMVKGVVRAILDLDCLNDFFLKPQEFIYGGKVYFYDPGLDLALPEGWKIPNVIKTRPYVRPNVPDRPEFLSKKHGFVRYDSNNKPKIAAFYKTSVPEFLFVVERHLDDVFAPIQTMGKVTVIMLIIVLATIGLSTVLMANPFLIRLQRCMAFAGKIREGHLDKRLDVKGNDEVARLGRGLNAMVDSLETNHKALEEAERLYRGIFENAVEGIFITDRNGLLLNANPAFASLLGYGSSSRVIGTNITKHYTDNRRETLLKLLDKHDTVKYFEINFRRTDGTERTGSIYARAYKGSDGKIVKIQGILDDITEIREIECQRRLVEEAELRYVQSQLEALRYQINPHFLFNILNSLDTLSESDPERVHELIKHLSHYLRSIFSASGSGFVPFREEIRTLGSYLHLQKIRFEDKLDVTFNISPLIHEVLVPELLLQPIVENAIKHGMMTTTLPLRIMINGITHDNLFRIEIANTGKLTNHENDAANGTGVGLENIRKRLELAYPGLYHFNVGEYDGWVRVIIEISGKVGDNEKQV